MAETLPQLRMDLEFTASPVPDRPGLMIRDPFHYSDTTLIVPPVLVGCLDLFDGTQTDLDLRAALVELTGDLRVADVGRQLREALSEAGFCHDETYERLRERQHQAFAQAEWRAPAHAGSAYPADPEELRDVLRQYMGEPAAPEKSDGLVGIAAPHVSPSGGCACYSAAYQALSREQADRIFVILGTSHYGEPDRFGLTRKSFVTPLGTAITATDLVDELAANGGSAVAVEDYCHAVEHSIEFQVVFLQHVFGPAIRILPILCGPFANEGNPEDDAGVAQFLAALQKVASRAEPRLFWVLGIDMAHQGRRYGDPFGAQAQAGAMVEVAGMDRERIAFIEAGDAAAFWKAAQTRSDSLKWCGTTPLYVFLKAVPGARGKLLRYDQWNIDEQSVVSFGAIAFRV